ncbi:siderophore-interacting protein [Glaciihabitans arcticus]|uniref:Siderophore-interacting protein n=1 Tax=Glaciihabitans arcticus TaxID=2668039 RepID=A0A4V2JEN6_9MICO|nr:SIP domain-containing protein [Glaciihabitans arcticus]TBN56279.1 siderophore-interacting protein [Glaciihabitans arcticus]
MKFPEQSTASIGWNPSADDRILLAGDEFDLDLIRTALATLPAKARGQVFIEVQSAEDVTTLEAPGRFSICWLVRDRGQQLRRSVDAWLSEMLPTSGAEDHTVYAWISHEGSARVMTSY